MRTIRTNFDRQEARRDRRYALPPLALRLADREFTTGNWSLGGFLVNGVVELDIGATVTGTFIVDGRTQAHEFTAQLVRRDLEQGTAGFHFESLSPAAVDELDRVLARRLGGGRK